MVVKHYDTRDPEENSYTITQNTTNRYFASDSQHYLSKLTVTVKVPTYEVVKSADALTNVTEQAAIVISSLLATPTVSSSGGTSISVANIDPEATAIGVYANGTKIGTVPIE